MKPERTSYDELQDAVNDVKHLKPAEIASLLRRRKILGRPGTTGRCPLALLMHGARGGHFVVGQKWVMRQSGESVEKIKTPENLAAFVRMFDAGQFRDLIQVPPRCLPKRARSGKTAAQTSGTHHARKRGPDRLQLAKEAQRFKPVPA